MRDNKKSRKIDQKYSIIGIFKNQYPRPRLIRLRRIKQNASAAGHRRRRANGILPFLPVGKIGFSHPPSFAIRKRTPLTRRPSFVGARSIRLRRIKQNASAAGHRRRRANGILPFLPVGKIGFSHPPSFAIRKRTPRQRRPFPYGGDEGARTLDLTDVNRAL